MASLIKNSTVNGIYIFTPFPKPVIMEVCKYVYVTDCDNGSPSRVKFEFSNNCPDNYSLCQFRL